ncbi:MAG: hypothetical protein IJQ28_07075 [Clostridia bacterium]|nr:hypothetical protein [Clostridia bacterium]
MLSVKKLLKYFLYVMLCFIVLIIFCFFIFLNQLNKIQVRTTKDYSQIYIDDIFDYNTVMNPPQKYEAINQIDLEMRKKLSVYMQENNYRLAFGEQEFIRINPSFKELKNCFRFEKNEHTHNEIISVLMSPDGKHKLMIFNRNINATTEDNLQISVLETKETLKDSVGNLLIIEGNAFAKWIDDKNVLIKIEKNSKVYKTINNINGISVIYTIEE